MNKAEIRENLIATKAAYDAARRDYLKVVLEEVYQRDQKMPDWPEWTGQCSNYCYNICPITHPVHGYRGVGCCDCGKSWKDSAMKPYARDLVSDQVVCEYTLRSFGFTASESLFLIAKYGTARIAANCRSADF